MTAFTLYRNNADDQPTLGRIENEEHVQIIVTLEPPDNGNRRDISCIPATGPETPYHVAKKFSPEHGRVVPWILDVPDRDSVEMHIGCLYPRDTKGCVLCGTAFAWVDYADGKPNASGHGVTGSHDAFDKWMAATPDEFDLFIIAPSPMSQS